MPTRYAVTILDAGFRRPFKTFGSSRGASVIAMDVIIRGEVRGNGDQITQGLEVTVRIWLVS